MKRNILITISLMALILFSGCNSSFKDYKNSCIANDEIQKEVLNKSLGTLEHYDSKYYSKLESYCINKYSKSQGDK